MQYEYLIYLKGGENMNTTINNVINKTPENIIKKNRPNSMKGVFAKIIRDSMTDNQSMIMFTENNFNKLISMENTQIPIDENNVVEAADETKNQYSYEILSYIADILFFRPDALKNDIKVENKEIIRDHTALKIPLPSKDIDCSSMMSKEGKHEIPSVLYANNNGAEKLSAVIEGNEKSKNEYKQEYGPGDTSAFTPIETGKIITISDESTEIKSQVLAQVRDKIIILSEKGTDLNGVKTITMELQPHNLGKVHIKMISEDNKLTVEIKALNEETQKIISSNTGELKSLLNKSSEADVKIVVKPYLVLKQESVHNYNNEKQGKENNFYQNNDKNHQGRQKNKYYFDDNPKQKRDDSFSQLVNLSWN